MLPGLAERMERDIRRLYLDGVLQVCLSRPSHKSLGKKPRGYVKPPGIHIGLILQVAAEGG